VLVTWQRPPAPDDKLYWAVEIWLPPALALDPPGPFPDDTWLIEPPPVGKATIISIGFSRIPKGAGRIPADVRELGHTRLSTGEYVEVFARPVDFDYEATKPEINQQLQSSHRNRQLFTSEEDLFNVKRLRVLLINNPKVDGFLRIIDSALTVSR
jgi:hypothetical protein